MAIIRRTITRDENRKYEYQDDYENNFHRLHFDARLYHVLTLSSRVGTDASMTSNGGVITTNLDNGTAGEEFKFAQGGNGLFIYPYHTYGNFSGDYYETEDAIVERIAQVNMQIDAQKADSANSDASTLSALENERKALYERYGLVKDFNEHFQGQMLAPHSLIHPYAIVKLAGSMGSRNTVEGSYVFDSFATRRWYETDGDNISAYAATPTTTKIIAYEVPSVKVTLAEHNDDDNDNEENSESSSLAGIIAGSIIGGLVLIALIVFIIWRCHKRKTEGDYSEKKEELIELKND